MQEHTKYSSSRARILQAAKHLFAQRGYDNTSTVMIVRAAGTSESQLVKHFGSKCGLLEAILDQGWQEMGDLFGAVVNTTPPIQRLFSLLERVLAGLNRDPELKELLLFESRCISRRGGTVPITGGFRSFIRQLDAMLEHMCEENELRPGLSPQALSSALVGLCEGMLRDELVAAHSGSTLGYTAADFRHVIEVFLTSLLFVEQERQECHHEFIGPLA